MRKDREENLDYLDEEDTGIEDERQGFSGSPKKRIAGARAFVGLMVLIGRQWWDGSSITRCTLRSWPTIPKRIKSRL